MTKQRQIGIGTMMVASALIDMVAAGWQLGLIPLVLIVIGWPVLVTGWLMPNRSADS